MSVYTKTGDLGETSVMDPSQSLVRVSKTSPQIKAIGAVDELTSYLGVCISVADKTRQKALKEIVSHLYSVNALLAGSDIPFPKSAVTALEVSIDEMEARLPRLNHFILPTDNVLAAHLNMARALTRRAERAIIGSGVAMSPVVLAYINRLSDYLFTLVREVNEEAGTKVEPWIGKKI